MLPYDHLARYYEHCVTNTYMASLAASDVMIDLGIITVVFMHGLALRLWERTLDFYLCYLHPAPTVGLDFGGANSEYSFGGRAGQCYGAYLIDIDPHHLENAGRKAAVNSIPQLAGKRVGDMLMLDYPDNFAGSVILHGPLYHLPDHAEDTSG